jgi:hypothetical protein
MGATEERLKEVGYEKAIALNEVFLRKVFGKSESLLSSPWCKSGFVSRKFCGIHRLCL